MAEEGGPRFRVGRIFTSLLFLTLVGVGVYGASWINARRYFLVVEATEVRVEKGRMLPVGRQMFTPPDPALRGAYESFVLPPGMAIPRGETRFDDRVELDQALHRILRDALQRAHALETQEGGELAAKYLARMRALPGINLEQQAELQAIEREMSYTRAVGRQQEARRILAEAAELFRASEGTGRSRNAMARAEAIDGAIRLLDAAGEPEATPGAGAAEVGATHRTGDRPFAITSTRAPR